MYFGSVCELDIIFNFEKAYFILDELVLAGEIQDTSKKSVLRQVELSDSYQEEELISLALRNDIWKDNFISKLFLKKKMKPFALESYCSFCHGGALNELKTSLTLFLQEVKDEG